MLFLLLAPLILLSNGLVSNAAEKEPVAVARKAVDLLLAENYPALRSMFNKQMSETLTDEILRTRVSKFMKEVGKPQSFDPPVVCKVENITVVVLPGHFPGGPLDFQVGVEPSGKIAGLFFRQPDKASQPNPPDGNPTSH